MTCSNFYNRFVLCLCLSIHLSLFAQTPIKLEVQEAPGSYIAKFSPNGKYLVTATQDKILLHEKATGYKLTTIELADLSSVESVDFTHDGKHIVTKFSDKIVIYDMFNGNIIKQIAAAKAIILPNKKGLICFKESTLKTDIFNGYLVITDIDKYPNLYKYSLPDGQLIDSIPTHIERISDIAYDAKKHQVHVIGQTNIDIPNSTITKVIADKALSVIGLDSSIIKKKTDLDLPFEPNSLTLSPLGSYMILMEGINNVSILSTQSLQPIALNLEIPETDLVWPSFIFSPDECFLGMIAMDTEDYIFTDKYLGNKNPEAQKLFVFDIKKNQLLFQRTGVTDVQFLQNKKSIMTYPNKDMKQKIVYTIDLLTSKVENALEFQDRPIIYLEPLNQFYTGGHIWDVALNKIIKSFKGEKVKNSYPLFGPDMTLYIPTENQGLKIFNPKNITGVETIPVNAEKIHLSNDGKLMAYVVLNEKKIEVRKTEDRSLFMSIPLEELDMTGKSSSHIQISPHSKYLSFRSSAPELNLFNYYKIFDLKTGVLIRIIPASILIQNAVFVGKEDYLLVPRVTCNLKNHPHPITPDILKDNQIPIGQQQSIHIIDLANGDVVNCWEAELPSRAIVSSPSGNKVAFLNTRINSFMNATDFIEIIDLEKGINSITIDSLTSGNSGSSNFLHFSQDEDFLYRLHRKKDWILDRYDLKTKKKKTILKDINLVDGYGFSFDISKDDKLATFYRKDGLIDIWDVEKEERLLSILVGEADGYLILTPKNYFYGTRGILDKVCYTVDNQPYSFRQFDLKFNRPDLILKKYPYSSKELIPYYYKAYEKRREKMGFDAVNENAILEVPQLEVLNENFPPFTKEQTFNLKIAAKDNTYFLDRINIWINDVPIFGKNGYSIKEEKIKNYNHNFKLQLNQGINQITVSAVNELGIESLLKNIEIESEPTIKAKPNLYVITIGVSKFQNAKMDLNYAVKDVQDVAALFESSSENCFIYNLWEQDMNLQSLQKLKAQLKKTKVDDKVILFIAGHGILDKKLDYYFPIFNTNFSNLQKNSIPYNELELLLDGIPARNKLILIDACHSGEIDKGNVSGVDSIIKNDSSRVIFRSVNQSIKQKIGLTNSFNLMKNLFVDLRRNTGAHVISSASGGEFALEGEDWQNGIFTYTLLNGLKSGYADLNGDGDIRISELQEYLVEQVSSLTKNHQKPTFRVENLSNNWRIWGDKENHYRLLQKNVWADGSLNEEDYWIINKKYETGVFLSARGKGYEALPFFPLEEISQNIKALEKQDTLDKSFQDRFKKLEYNRCVFGSMLYQTAVQDWKKVEQFYNLILAHWHEEFINRGKEHHQLENYNFYLQDQFSNNTLDLKEKTTLKVAEILQYIAGLFEEKDNYKEADRAYNQVLTIYEHLLIHPDTNWITTFDPETYEEAYFDPKLKKHFELIDLKYEIGMIHRKKHLLSTLNQAEKVKNWKTAINLELEWIKHKNYPTTQQLNTLLQSFKIPGPTKEITLKTKKLHSEAYNKLVNTTRTKDYWSKLYYTQKSIELLSELEDNESNRLALSNRYGSLSWWQIFNQHYKEALASAKKGLTIDVLLADKEWIKTNEALAYLFTNQLQKAKEIYLSYKDKKFNDTETFKEVFLDDFQKLSNAGIYHKDVEVIKVLLNEK